MKSRLILAILFVMILASLACGPLQDLLGGNSEPQVDPALPTKEPASAPIDAPEQPDSPSAELPSCDSPATPLALNSTVDLVISPTGEGYPANCLYYCVDVPAGQSAMDVRVYDFNTDIDLFVGQDSIDSVRFNDATLDADYPWRSNAYELADEAVTVNSPEAGLYYFEICAYESGSSPFTVSVNLR